MNKMDATLTQVKCPACGHEFNAEDVITHQAEERARAKFEQRDREAQARIAAKERELNAQAAALLKSKGQIELEVQAKLAAEKDALRKQIKQQLESEQAARLSDLEEELAAKSQETSALKAKELELMKEKRALEEKQRDFDTEVKKKLLESQTELEAKIRKQEQEAAYMKLKEEEKKNSDLRDQIEELKRKAQQGSTQLQGEVQEIELHQLLGAAFRFDHTQEVKKGVSGADLVQEVRTPLGKKAGNIAWDSKRTKAFSDTWIPKLKEDMMRHKAEIGVIVTETMPTDMPRFGLRDGIWICTFHEAVALAAVLREGLLRLADVRESEHNKGEKAQLLYAYIMSMEFQQQLRAIVEGFSTQKALLEQEKKTMQKIWKAREKSIDGIILNAMNMEGAIQGISGMAADDLLQLEEKYMEGSAA